MSNDDIKKQVAKAMELCDQRKFAEAEKLLHEILEKDSKQSDVWRLLAQIDWYEHHDIDKAEDELIEALTVEPKNLWALVLMGNLLSKERNDLQAAKKYYDKVLEFHSDDAIALNNIGAVYYQNKDYDTAIHYFQKAIDADNTYANSYYGMACCFEASEHSVDAFNVCVEGAKKGKNRPENPHVREELLKMELYLADKLFKKTNFERIYENIRKDLESLGGCPVKIILDPTLKVYAKMEYHIWHNTAENVVRYKEGVANVPHLLVHELMHLQMCINNTKAGKGKVIATTEENKSAFMARFAKLFSRINMGLPKERLDGFLDQLYHGLVLHVMNTPLDLFVEDLIYNEHHDMRPAQLNSLFYIEQQNIKAANDREAQRNLPPALVSMTKVLNMVSSMHFKQLYGIDLIHEYHPNKHELDQATDLYEEYKAYIDTFKTGDEYELMDYFAASLNVDDFFTIADEQEQKVNTDSDDHSWENNDNLDERMRIAEESLEASEKQNMTTGDVDAANAQFALDHQDGADKMETMMMSMYMLGAM